MNKSYIVKDICQHIDAEYSLRGEHARIVIDNIANPFNADKHSMIFISPSRKDKQQLLKATHAGLILCDDSIAPMDPLDGKCFIVVNDPKYVFATLGNKLFLKRQASGIHASAIIHPEASIDDNVYIGPHSYIGKCDLAKGTVIYGNCYLYDNVIVGENVIINAGCVIGANGCGHLARPDGSYEPFPHIGRVVLEDNVEIGPNSCIARGALGDTVVKQGTVIDSFVQIGHNVIVDENVLILANVVIGGSSHIKKKTVLAIGAHICDYVTIGENAHVGPGVVVMQSVADGGKMVARPAITLPQSECQAS